MNSNVLAERLTEVEQRYAGTISLDVRRLDAPGRLSRLEHEILPTASTCKLFVLGELFRQAEVGVIDLHAPLTARPEFWCGGDGVLRGMRLPETLSAYNMAVLMTVVSDNVATAAVIDLVGPDNVARAVRDWGLADTGGPDNSSHLQARWRTRSNSGSEVSFPTGPLAHYAKESNVRQGA